MTEILLGKTTVSEASRAYDLAPSAIEDWSNRFLLPMGTYRIDFRPWVACEMMQDFETKLAEGEGHKGRSAVISLIGM